MPDAWLGAGPIPRRTVGVRFALSVGRRGVWRPVPWAQSVHIVVVTKPTVSHFCHCFHCLGGFGPLAAGYGSIIASFVASGRSVHCGGTRRCAVGLPAEEFHEPQGSACLWEEGYDPLAAVHLWSNARPAAAALHWHAQRTRNHCHHRRLLHACLGYRDNLALPVCLIVCGQIAIPLNCRAGASAGTCPSGCSHCRGMPTFARHASHLPRYRACAPPALWPSPCSTFRPHGDSREGTR